MPDGTTRFRTGGSTVLVTAANAVTLARLCAVPFTVWLVVRGRYDLAFLLFAGAGLSDALDGWLARRGGASALGAVLDPVADKLLLVSMFVTLAAMRVLPDWLAILVVFRDLVVVGGVLVLRLLGQTVVIRPLTISKSTTALQIVLVAAALLLKGFGLGTPVLVTALVWLVAAVTLASGGAYVLQALRSR